jgi:hypothetical protein
LGVRFANKRNTSAWSATSTDRNDEARNAAIATDRASFGSFLSDRPVPSTRTRDASVAGTSTTVSPAATSCCDNK